jgi:hypothetical protein
LKKSVFNPLKNSPVFIEKIWCTGKARKIFKLQTIFMRVTPMITNFNILSTQFCSWTITEQKFRQNEKLNLLNKTYFSLLLVGICMGSILGMIFFNFWVRSLVFNSQIVLYYEIHWRKFSVPNLSWNLYWRISEFQNFEY